MSFIDDFFETLQKPGGPLIAEIHGSKRVPTERKVLAQLVSRARGTILSRGVSKGDRVVLLASNSSKWLAADLALLFSGAIVVPMYARQEMSELVESMNDCEPTLVITADLSLANSLKELWPEAPTVHFDALFDGEPVTEAPVAREPSDAVTLIYTSGTSGKAKGVITTVANVNFMLPTTAGALKQMMGADLGDDEHIFHYLPFCFAGSRIVLWTCVYREKCVQVSTDLDNLLQEIGTASPHYFLNVPMLLERIKTGVVTKLRGRAAPIQWLYDRALLAHERHTQGTGGRRDKLALQLADRVMFSKIREAIGPNLRCLICGSAPLAESTQRWFEMVGIAVYQVYGLTETTAIITMDRPPNVTPGRVGPLVHGIEAKLSAEQELLTRGPHLFAGYWNNKVATEDAFVDGWFRTGDKADVDVDGNYKILGRVKNLIVLSSGHNVVVEPIEQQLISLEGVEHVVLVGHGEKFMAALFTGTAESEAIQHRIDEVNATLPHYQRIRAFHLCDDLFTIENKLLTANRKLRRTPIIEHYSEQIQEMYH